MYGPHRRFAPLLPRTLRRIPQAVGTVATLSELEEEFESDVSIPQAVGTVATGVVFSTTSTLKRFNTASGRYCCNDVYGKRR